MSQPANDDYSQHLSDDEASYHEEASDSGTATNKPKQQQQQLTPTTTTISNIKLPILKKEEKDGVVRILPPVSAAEIHAVEKERKTRTILLMAIPKEHLRRFHGMDDAKEIWEAIRTRFGGNANSKKMRKAVLKQQFEAFSISSSEGLEKAYDGFQQLLSQLEAHGAEVSTEDINHKFLRYLPPAWSNLAMTMRTKPDVDTLSIDDLYNNLRVFEQELTSTSKSSTSAQNVAFVSHSKSITNKVKSGHTSAYSTYTPTSSNNIQEREVPAGFADEVIYSLFAKQYEYLDLLHEDLEQIDDVHIEEIDINWQIAMIAIQMKKFYKKTGRRVRIDGNKPVGFDKKNLECFKCHNTGHFARVCPSKGINDGKKRDSFYQDQGAGKKEQNQNCLLTMDDGVVNWGEHTVEEEETNHALMAISSNNEVSLCFKTCIDSYNKLKTLCDEQMNQLGEQEANILAYTLAVKKLEAQIVTFQKQQLSLIEQLTFQANEIYAKDEKLKRYRRIGMKAVKEKEQLKKIVDSWKDSSKNLWKLIDSGMSSTSKVGLGFTKTNSFKGVSHPLTGDYTPKPQEEIDDSLYVYGKKGPQKPEVSDSDDNSTKHSTCQSNDSEGSCGNTSEHNSETKVESISVPNEMSMSKSVITNEKVVSESKEFEPSCAKHVKTPRQQMKNQGTSEVKGKNWNKMMERKLGEGYTFIKKKCFVCGSLSHLIKDCDYYEKKMAREAEFKKQMVFNTGNRVAKPVWTNANRINHANQFVPRPVQLNASRPNINSVRPNINTGRKNVNSVRTNINTGRTNVNSVRPKVNTVSSNVNTVRSRQPVSTRTSNSFSPKRPQVNQFNQRSHFSKSHSPVRRPIDRNTAKMSYFNVIKGNWALLLRPQQDHLLKNMEDKGIFDSGCSGHMTGNKDHLDDFEECKGGYVNFGGSKGYITGKGRIRMPDENQILLKFLRQHNMYSFDMKTPSLTKDYACLIAKATCDESKLWHRRFSRVFFLATKDETSGILQNFIRQIENQFNHRVRIIRSDNGTEFKNRDMLEFCGNKRIKQEYSNARTLQQNGVAERMNKTLIEAARTMLCDEGFLVGYSLNSKAFRVYNLVTKKVEVNLHVKFLKEKPNVKGVGISEVTNSAGTLQTPNANASEEADEDEELIVVPTAIKHSATKVGPRKSSTNSKEEKFLTELQNLQTQEKEADYDEVFAYVARIEAIRLFLAFASFMGFIVYQMDVKSAFLYGTIDEEVYVSQPPGFVDPDHLKKVYKFVKALYGLHQTPRAWYATLSTFLEEHGYKRGTIDKTLFIKKDKEDIMLVQVYVDDIIFGSTRKPWCDEFKALMKGRFQMSSMGELIFFLGLQVKQKTDGIFISQDKYVADMLKKFNLASVKTAITPMETKMALTKDEEAADVDVTPTTSHLNAMKRIFKNLKGKPNLGLWYHRELSFDLEAFSDSDYARANLDRKSTIGGCQFLGSILISWQCKK
ncbi:putative ribonuclease H-like domain-containing protein [Tanacetum coccineum]|uniref:Ribonuclease H-like domain-containing protein n=1 Tax=Tanacetum coccineum TaxID=301880 RepID=A0ABQ5IB49_9ASTR